MPDVRGAGALSDPLPDAVQYALIRELLFGDQFDVAPAAPNWTVTNANGGTSTVTLSELTMATSANANGSTRMESFIPVFTPGSYCLFHAAVAMGDTGFASNTRRFGVFTGGLSPVDGYLFEMSGTGGTNFSHSKWRNGSNAGGTSNTWAVPFTIDTNYHIYEILYSEIWAMFAVDGIPRAYQDKAGGGFANIAAASLPVAFSNAHSSAVATDKTMKVAGASLTRIGAEDPYPSNTSVTTVAASASNVTLLSANQNRKGAVIYNDSASQVYVKLGATASTTSFTVLVPPGGTYTVDYGYAGRVDAIWTTATGNARITELFA